MSPTIDKYYNNLLLSNFDENKNKLFETPQKYSNFPTDMNWCDNNAFNLDTSPLYIRSTSNY
jgi:hypothetical protein